MKYLKLNLSGVLQYFSSNTTSSIRSTYNTSLYPTARAINGLICSAFGYPRNDARIEQLFQQLIFKYSVISNPIVLNEFQIIKPLKSAKSYMNTQYKLGKFTNFMGADTESNIVKHIQYLQNAEFDVYVGSESDELLQSIFDSLQNPIYALYIGKRNCVPNKPIVTEFELLNEEDLSNVYDCA